MLHAFEASGKTLLVAVTCRGRGGRVHNCIQPGARAAQGVVEFLERKRQLIRIELLGSNAEPVSLERGEDRVQPLDLRLRVRARALQIGDALVASGDPRLGRDQHLICAEHGIKHRLANPNYPWTNAPVKPMNRTIKDATVKNYHPLRVDTVPASKTERIDIPQRTIESAEKGWKSASSPFLSLAMWSPHSRICGASLARSA